VRVLYFTRDFTPHDHRFLSSLAKTEHEVFSLRLERSSRQMEDRALPSEVRQVQWRGGREAVRWRDYPALRRDFLRVLREVKPDLVHAGPVPNVAFLAALSGFRPLVSMSWGSDLLRDIDRNRSQRWAARYALRRSSILLGDCLAVQRKAAALGFPGDRVVLFPWGVDLERFTPGENQELRARLGWQDAFVLLSLRSWEPVYGVDVITQAFARAVRQEPNLRLILLAGGSQASHIRETLSRAGVEEYVYFGGQVSNDRLPDYYHAADLYLSASHSDGSSVSLMEALACGKPVLVSDIPGNREWIENSPAGWLFEDGNADALALRIRLACNQKQTLQEAGTAARRLAEQRADWKQNFQQLLKAYEMALDLKEKHQ
jgi:L-malate glycosyltransferase